MIVLLDTAGASVTFAAVWSVWQAKRLWLYWRRLQRVIRGQVEPPRQVYRTPVNGQPARDKSAAGRGMSCLIESGPVSLNLLRSL